MRPQTELLANRYRLTALIAGGGMGQVWRGHDTLLDRPVAVKVLRDQFAGDPTFRTRFRAEAQHAAGLTHPHIAAVFDYGELPAGDDGVPVAYLVMELVDGESLADLLARERRLDAARTVDIVRQAADGLAAAHAAGVVHRDIKPANLLVTPRGVVKLTDFGIARSASSVAVTGTGQVIGTAHYFSPEQASGNPSTPASDVYALGAVAYECLAGRRPFEADNPVQIAVMHIRDTPAPLPAGVPADVRALVERAMAKDPAARFPDGAALRDAAGRLAAGLPTSPSPRMAATAVLPAGGPTTVPVPVPAQAAGAAVAAAPGRRRWLIPALVALAVAVLAVAVLATVLPGRSGTPASGATPSSTGPAGIEVVAADLVGRPVQDVQAELVGRGLRVELVASELGDVPAGQVTAVDPVGTLAPGDVVRLTYAVPPVPVPAPVDPGEGADEEAQQEREEAQKEREEERKKEQEERKKEEEERKKEQQEEDAED